MIDEHDDGPPRNIRAEQALLGALMLDPSAFDRLADGLRGVDFYRGAHGTLFKLFVRMRMEGKGIDPISVEEELARAGVLALEDGEKGKVSMQTVYDVRDKCTSAANVEYYSDQVQRYALRRRGISFAHTVDTKAHDMRVDEFDMIDWIEQHAHDLAGTTPAAILDHEYVVREALRGMCGPEGEPGEERVDLPPMPSGWACLDEILPGGGFGAGHLILVGGRTKQGKSSLMSAICANATRQGIRTGFVSLEVTIVEIVDRIVGSLAAIPLANIRRGERGEQFHPDAHSVAMLEAGQIIQETGGPMVDGNRGDGSTGAKEWQTIRGVIRRWVRMRGVRSVFVDQLSHIDGPRSWGASKVDSYDHATKALKSLALELSITIFLAHQLKKPSGDRPAFDDFRWCTTIAEHADGTLLWDINDDDELRGRGLLQFVKNRHGEDAEVYLRFDKVTGRFSEILRAVESGA